MTARRRKKRSNDIKQNLLTLFAIAVVAILFVTIAESTCAKNKEDRKLEEGFYGTSLAALTQVTVPDFDDAEMIYYPGFDVCFSNDHHQPYYVSWVLTGENAFANKVKRANNFRPDPDVTGSPQLSDYRNSGYDRGHMAPSADFKWLQEAQDATFFLTNMSPQKSALNTGAWANLEEQCRQWAKRDSIIVVITGPVLTDRLTRTIGKTKVTVPDRYFKVVLAPYADPPRAIGFILPNNYVEGGVQSSVVTVDQVEAITGFDFFSELPDDVESIVESNARYSEWQYPKRKKKK